MNTCWLVVGLGMLTCGTLAGEFKVAVVDAGRLLKQYHKTELAESHIKEQLEDFTAERDKLLAEVKRLRTEFEALHSEAQNKALTEEARDKRQEQAEDKLREALAAENALREKAASRRKQLEGEGRRMQMELVRAIRKAVETCAAREGYTLVLDSSGLLANGFECVVHYDPALDITEQVLKVLNAEQPEGQPKAAEKPKPPAAPAETPK